MWSAIKQRFTPVTNSISFTHKWTIENFAHIYSEADHLWKWRICSNNISPLNNEIFIFQLDLYPKGDCEAWKNYVSIGVDVLSMPRIYEGKIRCGWRVSIEDVNGNWCKTREMKSYNLFEIQSNIASDLIEYSSLLNCATKYLPNSQLTLHFEINLQADERIFNVITNNEPGQSQFDCANKVSKVAHTWTIDNFAQVFSAAPYFIQSKHFPALSDDILCERFCLRLCPNGWREEIKDNVDIVIWNDNESSATVQWRLAILDVDGKECHTLEWTGKMNSKNGRIIGYNRASLIDESKGLVEGDKLKIYCEMNYVMDAKQITLDHSQIMNTLHKSASLFNVTLKVFHRVFHRWTIHKFSAQCLNGPPNRYIDSAIFHPPIDPRFQFYLRLWPNCNLSKQYLSLELHNISHDFDQVTVQYRLSILNSNGDKLSKWGNQSTITRKGRVSKTDFIPRSAFQTPFQISHFLPNDKLTIICEAWVIQDRMTYKTKPGNTHSLVNNASGSSAVLNISNANLQGAIINIQGILSMNDFSVKTSNNNNNNKL